MREVLRQLVESGPHHARTNRARDYVQARILAGLQRTGGMVSLAFVGGTALRFLYGLPRFSEDLDFTKVESRPHYDLKRALQAIRQDLINDGLPAEIDFKETTAVQRARVRLPGLLYALGLSPHENATLMIRLAVDTRPPAGAGLETTIVRVSALAEPLRLQHHDKASLLAGKLHALLQRPYAKGRDYYDLAWYLSDRTWPEPNLVLLDNALAQTGWRGPRVTATWRRALLTRFRNVDWSKIRADVAPFLESPDGPGGLGLLTQDTLRRLLVSRVPERPSRRQTSSRKERKR